MAKPTSIVEEVLGSVVNTQTRPTSWFERLPEDAQQELERVRQSFDPAIHQKRAFYRALAAAAEKRGWSIAGEKQVIDWLARKR